MSGDPQLRDLYAGAKPRSGRMSREVVVPLLVAAGAVGLPLVIGVAQCAREDDEPDDRVPVVNADTAYPNNHCLPGAGYYHAPYRAWFPLPFNHYEAGRGWFRGGSWRGAAQADEAERRAAGTSGFAGTQSRALPAASRPTPEAVLRANAGARAKAGPVIRGGFGHSSRPSIS